MKHLLLPILAASLAQLAVTGCGNAGASSQSPTQLDAQMVKWMASGQYGKVYDVTHPAQQKVVPYSKYFDCVSQGMVFAKAFGYDVKTARVVHARVAPKQRMVPVSGTHLRVLATAVWTTVSAVAGGKRTAEPSDSPDYFAHVGGQWRYIDDSIGDYLKPNCGS